MSATDEGKSKVSKKDRHMHCLHELSKFLERVNEDTVQQVLLLTRVNRETFEDLDDRLDKFCQRIDIDSFLLDKSEPDLYKLLDELKKKIVERENTLNKFESDLDNTEIHRAAVVAAELKTLVDKLIAIAHQLPDDIQRLVENEAFEINQEVIRNRLSHAEVISIQRIRHVQLEYECLEKWEATRRKWRQLRHNQALTIYQNDIRSDYYNDPEDRKEFLANVRHDQMKRGEVISNHILELMSLHYNNITSELVQAVQSKLSLCNEVELEAVQGCYNGLTQLRLSTDYLAKQRVEQIRKELHVYGALQVDPKLYLLADQLEDVIADPSLADLWRLGGGLKPDLQSLISELTCDDIVYDRVITSMLSKLELIIASFNLKRIMIEKGRQSQLDKIRGTVTKMRSAPRAELAAILTASTADFMEVAVFEGLPEIFKTTIEGIVKEINEELESLEKRMAQAAAAALTLDDDTKLGGGTMMAMTSGTAAADGHNKTRSKSVTMKETASGTSLHSAKLGGMTSGGKTKKGTMGKTNRTGHIDSETIIIMTYADPSLVKNWHRTLAILFYGSDLPDIHQELCIETFSQVTQQRECNTLVDTVVTSESEKLLKRMDNRYGKLIDAITAFLENQANFLSVQTANIGDFYLILAKKVELHRTQQKVIDNKSADEMWDISEEFRLELEDREAAYEAACQRIRESTKQEEIDKNFQDVLTVLDGIQASYRTFHQDSCFAADRYAVYLIDEFRLFLMESSRHLYALPIKTHPMIVEYDRLFDSLQRLNKQYFDVDPLHAAKIDRYSVIEDIERDAIGDEFSSPWTPPAATDATTSKESIAAYYGPYRLLGAITAFWEKFSIDSAFKEVKDVTDDAQVDDAVTTNNASAALLYSPHPNCVFMKSESVVLPMTMEELTIMQERGEDGKEDLEDYELALVKGFVTLPSTAPDPATTTAGTHPSPFPLLHSLSPEDQAHYEAVRQHVEQIKNRLTEQATPDYIRQHIPKDRRNEPWIILSEVTTEELTRMYEKLRRDIIINIEMEAFKKIATTEREMNIKKTELTDQLEERIRNHWPRRGRVETEIKQPREAELLSHKDKTWRMIQGIQFKSIDLQERFDHFMSQSKQACDDYVNDMNTLRNSLNGGFKNLAALQGIDVKARSTTIDFQADCVKRLQHFDLKLTSAEVELIVNNAREFRKVCPLQTPGQQGGYSESELQEIEVLIEGQCTEILEVNEQQWKVQVNQLREQQQQSLRCQQEFSTKYAKCTQEVAMAEGLGQKYGAPRRRAQERIRSEVARDERNAGKVDELLAQLDFITAEAHLNLTNLSSSQQVLLPVDLPPPPPSFNDESTMTPSDGRDSLQRMNYTWLLLKTLREALQKRVAFLKVQGEQGPPKEMLTAFPWTNDNRLTAWIIPEADQPPSPFVTTLKGSEEVIIPGQVAQLATLELVFDDVNTICRKETKHLYESEGLGAALGATGIPESLENWLRESKEKLLGRHGYQERAWKRLWAQLDRLDHLFARFRIMSAATEGDNEHPEVNTTTAVVSPSSVQLRQPVQSACIHFFVTACISFARFDYQQRVVAFQQLLQIWDKSREKHERMLRPRLGSPDKADELKELDTIEKQRSQEMVENVTSFRTALIRTQLQRFRAFCEDLLSMSKAFILMLDTIFRQELVALPPDTEIPKKHMTLKKLRKAQRIRDEVARGGTDRSVKRVWPGIALDVIESFEEGDANEAINYGDGRTTIEIVRSYENLVHDLGKESTDSSAGELAETLAAEAAASATAQANAAAAGVVSGKKGAPAPKKEEKKEEKKKDGKKDKNAVEATPVTPPSLLPDAWLTTLKTGSEIEGLVSSAHRAVITARQQAIRKYTSYLQDMLEEIKETYTTMLSQEQSWNERWDRQVDMLRRGNV